MPDCSALTCIVGGWWGGREGETNGLEFSLVSINAKHLINVGFQLSFCLQKESRGKWDNRGKKMRERRAGNLWELPHHRWTAGARGKREALTGCWLKIQSYMCFKVNISQLVVWMVELPAESVRKPKEDGVWYSSSVFFNNCEETRMSVSFMSWTYTIQPQH